MIFKSRLSLNRYYACIHCLEINVFRVHMSVYLYVCVIVYISFKIRRNVSVYFSFKWEVDKVLNVFNKILYFYFSRSFLVEVNYTKRDFDLLGFQNRKSIAYLNTRNQDRTNFRRKIDRSKEKKKKEKK